MLPYLKASCILILQHIIMGICYSDNRYKSDHRDSTLPPTDLICFRFKDLQKATQNFKSGLPKGVYKGWINMKSFKASRPGAGFAIAVKEVSQARLQDQLDAVNFVGNLSHPNIVGLIGYCTEGNNMFLVSEYMARGNLKNHLFRTNKCRLSWSLRFKIVLGVAKGLAFFHSVGVSVGYRYLFKFNPSGVLLDSDHNPKLHGFSRYPYSDYGQKHAQIFAYAYSDPEFIAANYGACGIPIPYYDVYSYGVVLLEVLLGRRVTLREQEDHYWAQLCQPPHKCCQLDKLIDKGLKGKYPWDTAHAMAKLAVRCQSNELRSRPSMAEVVVELEALQSSASSPTSRWTENKNK